MARRNEAFDRVRDVERQAEALSFAAARLLAAAGRNPALLKTNDFDERDLRTAAAELRRTYLIRLFSEFEGVLRDYWRNGVGRPTRPNIEVLIERVAARRGAESAVVAGVHAVRALRNDLVHAPAPPEKMPPIADARRRLCRFLARLPPRW